MLFHFHCDLLVLLLLLFFMPVPASTLSDTRPYSSRPVATWTRADLNNTAFEDKVNICDQELVTYFAGLNPEYRLTAVLGDLEHKAEVYTSFGSASLDIVLNLITNREQANYIRERYPELIPADLSDANDHTIGTIFEYNYKTSITFVYHYKIYLQEVKTNVFLSQNSGS